MAAICLSLNVLSALAVNIWDLKMAITVPADVLAPDGAWPLADTPLPIELRTIYLIIGDFALSFEPNDVIQY